jgi:hypothetical protein
MKIRIAVLTLAAIVSASTSTRAAAPAHAKASAPTALDRMKSAVRQWDEDFRLAYALVGGSRVLEQIRVPHSSRS